VVQSPKVQNSVSDQLIPEFAYSTFNRVNQRNQSWAAEAAKEATKCDSEEENTEQKNSNRK